MTTHARNLLPALVLLSLLGACMDRDLKPLNPCLVSAVVDDRSVTNVDKVDLLFMVDSSKSMMDEQASLRREFPKLIKTLTSGVRADGTTFTPAKDLHLGVITSDIGLGGAPVPAGDTQCGGLGEDGLLQVGPLAELVGELSQCRQSYGPPPFIQYTAGKSDPMQVANDFKCLSAVGYDGCGFEQQLEAMLKAVWPAFDIDPATGMQWIDPTTQQPSNRNFFLGDGFGASTNGHGDGANSGFLRNTPGEQSLIALVMVTDEEDCSSWNPSHFDQRAGDGKPNLSCFNNPENLHAVERYVNAFKALRPDNDKLVVFAAIAGVPTTLVTREALVAADLKDPVKREAFYQGILGHEAMQEVPMERPAEAGGWNLRPSCTNGDSNAAPPRRIVEVARQFGENGIVQSICQDDFGPAIEAIIDIIAPHLGNVCLPRPLARNGSGVVACNVVWELPGPNTPAPVDTPRTCGQSSFLIAPEAGRPSVAKNGGQICQVQQLAVLEDSAGNKTPDDQAGARQGWYYDDFSPKVAEECAGKNPQRVTYTEAAKPPTGVKVKLECLSERPGLASYRPDINYALAQPAIGDACEEVERNGQALAGDAACEITLLDNTKDASMFCHPNFNMCMLGCLSDADCPTGWVCDDRTETQMGTTDETHLVARSYCVNPTCGDVNQ